MHARFARVVLPAALMAAAICVRAPLRATTIGAAAPEISAAEWLNAAPQTLAGLRGKVVLVEFWTLGCYNCRNVEPHVKAWQRAYAAKGLAVIGVHSPESSRERERATVEGYLREQGITYAVALDNDFAVWERFGNRAWPAFYLIDKRGVVRHVHVGEGGYAATEAQIQALLAEPAAPASEDVRGDAIEARPAPSPIDVVGIGG